MRYLLSPQVSEEYVIRYDITGEVVTVTLRSVAETLTDTFDFTGLPDGIAKDIETVLPVRTVIEAERINGILSLILVNFIGKDSTEEEKFPVWIEVL